jgi:enamine deaminase RidA (YjgF/YER057c/UK114 family)
MAQRLINPENVHSPIMPYSHAVVTGDTIYLSAQLPLGVDGRLVGRDDIDAQAEQVFTNMRNVLEGARLQVDAIAVVDGQAKASTTKG